MVHTHSFPLNVIPMSRALCSRNLRSKWALCAMIGASPTNAATRGSTWAIVSASATVSFVMPVSSRIRLRDVPRWTHELRSAPVRA